MQEITVSGVRGNKNIIAAKETHRVNQYNAQLPQDAVDGINGNVVNEIVSNAKVN